MKTRSDNHSEKSAPGSRKTPGLRLFLGIFEILCAGLAVFALSAAAGSGAGVAKTEEARGGRRLPPHAAFFRAGKRDALADSSPAAGAAPASAEAGGPTLGGPHRGGPTFGEPAPGRGLSGGFPQSAVWRAEYRSVTIQLDKSAIVKYLAERFVNFGLDLLELESSPNPRPHLRFHIEAMIEDCPECVQIDNKGARGTVFFINKKEFVTAAHMIDSLLRESELQALRLDQGADEDAYYTADLRASRLIAVSPALDLALLEATNEAPSYLKIRTDILLPGEEAISPSFPQGVRQNIKLYVPDSADIIARSGKQILWQYIDVYKDELSGGSGGPVIDSDNQAAGVLIGGSPAFVYVIATHAESLGRFIEGDLGVRCPETAHGTDPSAAARDCMQTAADSVLKKAAEGDISAQYEAGLLCLRTEIEQKEGPSLLYDSATCGDKEAADWLKKAASAGDKAAQYNAGFLLATRDKEGDIVTGLDYIKLSADQGYKPAEHFVDQAGRFFWLKHDIAMAWRGLAEWMRAEWMSGD